MNTVLLCGTIISIGREFTTEKGITKRSIGIAVKKGQYSNYFDIFCYGDLAKYAEKFLYKGDYVFVTARLYSRSEKKEDGSYGERKYTLIASDLLNLKSDEPSANEKFTKQIAEEGYLDVTSASTGIATKIINNNSDYDDELPF